MIAPPYLKKNDTVAIVSTARKISKNEIKSAINLLKSWGLQVVLGETIGLKHHQFSGTDTQRAQDFQAVLNNPKIKAIWCARGGYGTVRIIDLLDFSVFKQNPKWIIGFSDITVLHSHIHNLGYETIHATMPLLVSQNTKKALQTLKLSLFGKLPSYTLKSSPFNRFGETTGELIGGNLSVLYSLMGSPTSINTTGKILFLEDLDEYLYHIDRMLQNLKRNGVFNDLNGLIIGGITQMHDNKIPFGKNAIQIVLNCVSTYNFPVVFNFPAGHIKNNNALIFGKKVALLCGSKTQLKYI